MIGFWNCIAVTLRIWRAEACIVATAARGGRLVAGVPFVTHLEIHGPTQLVMPMYEGLPSVFQERAALIHRLNEESAQ